MISCTYTFYFSNKRLIIKTPKHIRSITTLIPRNNICSGIKTILCKPQGVTIQKRFSSNKKVVEAANKALKEGAADTAKATANNKNNNNNSMNSNDLENADPIEAFNNSQNASTYDAKHYDNTADSGEPSKSNNGPQFKQAYENYNDSGFAHQKPTLKEQALAQGHIANNFNNQPEKNTAIEEKPKNNDAANANSSKQENIENNNSINDNIPQENILNGVSTNPKTAMEHKFGLGKAIENIIKTHSTPSMPKPNNPAPLMITDGSELRHNTTASSEATPESSIQDSSWSDDAEDFLATPNGLVKTDSRTANDPVKANQEMVRVDLAYSSEKDINAQLNKAIKYHYFRNQDYQNHLTFGLSQQDTVPREFILTEIVPKKKFFKDLPFKETLHRINITDECKAKLKREFSTRIALLEVDIGKTEVLSNIQSHFVAYVEIDDMIIVYGYFTSEDANIHLSDKQPFDDEATEKKGQKFHPLEKPVIVSSSQLQNIEQPTLTPKQNELRRIAFANGAKYVEEPKIKLLLQKVVIEKTIDILETNGAQIYDGIGITGRDIDTVISMEEARFKKQAKLLFNEQYPQAVMNSQGPEWMEIQKEIRPLLYPYLVPLANKRNENNNDPKRYAEIDE